MPEYRRFVAYFYEYIDGKKQKNAGFAKVELRNGTWRILFRLMVPMQPQPPVDVFGFVREEEYLLGLPMGTMRAGREMMEEWAYHAEDARWMDQYRFSDFAGIWIRSGDGRDFITVWDEEPVDVAQFVTSLPQAAEENAGEQSVSEEQIRKSTGEQSVRDGQTGRSVGEQGVRDGQTGQSVGAQRAGEDQNGKSTGEQNVSENQVWQSVGEQSASNGQIRQNAGEQKMSENQVRKSAGEQNVSNGQTRQSAGEQNVSENQNGQSMDIAQMEWCASQDENPTLKNAGQEPFLLQPDILWQELYRTHESFQPFAGHEIRDCIRISLNDIMKLQRENWKTGRNSFLMHGYYNYHHLMIGKNGKDQYILGVPGLANPQEKYLAVMFGFPEFKAADGQDQGAADGYWCRVLEQER
jgi:hypothetical protein